VPHNNYPTRARAQTDLEAMNNTLSRGHRIEIRGCGSFSVKRQAPRMGRNPRSGQSVAIPEKREPGKALTGIVNGRETQK
jgi:integration host factor subunit beta